MRIRAPGDSRAPQHDAQSLTTKPERQEWSALAPLEVVGPNSHPNLGRTPFLRLTLCCIYVFSNHVLSPLHQQSHTAFLLSVTSLTVSLFTNYANSNLPIHNSHQPPSLYPSIPLTVIPQSTSRNKTHYPTVQLTDVSLFNYSICSLDRMLTVSTLKGCVTVCILPLTQLTVLSLTTKRRCNS